MVYIRFFTKLIVMSAVFKEFDSYKFWYYGKNQHRIQVQLYQGDDYVGTLDFRDADPIPDNELSGDFIRLSFQKNDFSNVIDLIRNEGPLFAWINPKNLIGGIATSENEPVGEGEEDD